jgi:hypothetical protein
VPVLRLPPDGDRFYGSGRWATAARRYRDLTGVTDMELRSVSVPPLARDAPFRCRATLGNPIR